jgi:hypothetical protein
MGYETEEQLESAFDNYESIRDTYLVNPMKGTFIQSNPYQNRIATTNNYFRKFSVNVYSNNS